MEGMSGYLKTDFFCCVIAVLIDNTLSFFDEFDFCFLRPPIYEISVFVELSSLIVETVSYFVSDNETDGSVIHILGAIVGEENTLKDSRGKFCWKFKNTLILSKIESPENLF